MPHQFFLIALLVVKTLTIEIDGFGFWVSSKLLSLLPQKFVHDGVKEAQDDQGGASPTVL